MRISRVSTHSERQFFFLKHQIFNIDTYHISNTLESASYILLSKNDFLFTGAKTHISFRSSYLHIYEKV